MAPPFSRGQHTTVHEIVYTAVCPPTTAHWGGVIMSLTKIVTESSSPTKLNLNASDCPSRWVTS